YLQPPVVKVDHANGSRRIELCSQQDRQPYRTRTDNGDRVPRLHLAVQHSTFETSRQDVTEHHERLFVAVSRYVIQTGVGMGDSHVLRLCAVNGVAKNPSAEPTVRVHPFPAVLTLATCGDAGNQHAVADAKACHGRADGLHDSDALMAEDPTVRNARHVTLQ